MSAAASLNEKSAANSGVPGTEHGENVHRTASKHAKFSDPIPAGDVERALKPHERLNDRDQGRGNRADNPTVRENGDWEMREEDCYEELGFGYSNLKKWTILSVIFIVQVSMNFNTSLYSNAIPGISEEFHVSAQAARCGAMIFLVLYAFGCELWAPWSEELGRKPVLQASLFLVNIFQLPVALAKNFGTVMAGRALGGLASAGGSVTLGMVADMWEADEQQYAVAFVVFSSVGGSVLGPVVGGFTEAYLDWRWSIWIQLIFGGFVQILHLFLVPETRSTVLMTKVAKKWRASGKDKEEYPESLYPHLTGHIVGPNENKTYRERFSMKEIVEIWIRPFKMFLTEPIVLTLSLLSGFSDALIFMFIQSFALVYKQWEFSTVALGLSFLPILVGYFIAWASFIPAIRRNIKQRKDHPESERAQYESRLWWLLWTAPLLPIGLFGFAWTVQGPPIHWIGSMVFAAIIGIANYAIYMATIDYMICAYGPYSASATGGNGWARDFLAGVLTIPATPFFSNIGKRPLEYANTILACISLILVAAVYAIYFYGPTLRENSPFAQQIAGKTKTDGQDAEKNVVATETDETPVNGHTPGHSTAVSRRNSGEFTPQRHIRPDNVRQGSSRRLNQHQKIVAHTKSGRNSPAVSRPNSAAPSRRTSLENPAPRGLETVESKNEASEL
ncbi:MFS multidrug transporter [Phlyctema vagabunda]|uniref:MFS multidrug transporter n=1 Tax=Phlyctema vagabunda TaxID=108571 RepID=A0ABR4PH32_9HELO